MKMLEDRVRAATRATAAGITPGSIPPLSLARPQPHEEPRGSSFPGGAGRGRARNLRLLVPVAAAAAVVAVVAVTSLADHTGAGRLPAGTVPLAAAPAGGTGTGTGTAPRGTEGTVPPYYVTLEPGPLSGASTRAVVRATATGKALATVTPPSPFPNFSAVTAAADDQTFVLAAQNNAELSRAPEKFFLLRLDPASGTATLSALPIPEEPASEVLDIALAPDGGRLAIALSPLGDAEQEQEIAVVNLRTGSERTWQGPTRGSYYLGGVVLGANALSWTADGRTLAFEETAALPGRRQPGQPIYSIRVQLLDTAAPGDDLWSSRTVAISGSATNAMITPDGAMIVAPVVTQTTREVAEYSASTGNLVAVLGVRHFEQAYDGGGPTLFWTNASGSAVIVYDAKQGSPLLTSDGGLTPFVLAVVTGSQFTPLPGSDSWGAW
jgi:hypothetical protein